MRGLPEYASWAHMKERCSNPRNPDYKNYGGRGICVCDAWRASFSAFLRDVGRRPPLGTSIERIDVNGNYQPGNVKWATAKEQTRNMRRTVRLTLNGITRSLPEWADVTGISYFALRSRIRYGWPVERVLQTGQVRDAEKHSADSRRAGVASGIARRQRK